MRTDHGQFSLSANPAARSARARLAYLSRRDSGASPDEVENARQELAVATVEPRLREMAGTLSIERRARLAAILLGPAEPESR